VAVSAIARLLLAAVKVLLPRPREVAANEQVEQSVAVVINKPRARRPAARADARLLRHVAERPAAVVAVERVAAVARHVQIRVAVVIEVPDRRAAVVARALQPCLRGHVIESPVGVLLIEPVPERRVALVRLPRGSHPLVNARAIREEDVEPTVVVVIEERRAAAHRFGQELGGRFRSRVTERDAARLGEVGELDSRHRRRLRERRQRQQGRQ
jgi:hypothetical protein